MSDPEVEAPPGALFSPDAMTPDGGALFVTAVGVDGIVEYECLTPDEVVEAKAEIAAEAADA